MNNDFLDNQNFSYLINFVRNDVNQQTDFDIFKEKKYVNLFKKLIQTIHTSNMNKRNVTKEYLNSVVIDKCVPFLVNQINNDMKKDKIFNLKTHDNFKDWLISKKETVLCGFSLVVFLLSFTFYVFVD